MKRLLMTAAALLLPTSAYAQTVTITGTATPTVHSSDPGLVLTSAPGVFSLNLDLDAATATPSSQFVGGLFTLGTGEGSVELFEDTTAYPISVLFSFTSPFGTASDVITGQSFGYYQLFSSCGLFAGGCGAVTWDGPQTFNFGDGGSFSLALNDVKFGTPGMARVGGTFTLMSSAVPEPATWAMLLLGFGAMGVSLRRRKRHPMLQTA